MTSENSVSGSNNQRPLDPETAIKILIDVILTAISLKIVSYAHLIQKVTVARLIESIRDDIVRRANLVHETLGTRLNLALAQSKEAESVDRQTSDIVYSINVLEDDEVMEKLVTIYGVDSIVRLITLAEAYDILKSTGWDRKDEPAHRQLAVRASELLLEHAIYEDKALVYEYICNSIGSDALMRDGVPELLRIAVFEASRHAIRSKNISMTTFGEIIFGTVPLRDFVEYIPVESLKQPFVKYVELLGAHELPKPPPLPKKKDVSPPPAPLPTGEDDEGRERRDSEGPAVSFVAVGTPADDGQEADIDDEPPECTGCGHKTVNHGQFYKCLNCGNHEPLAEAALPDGG
jgi:hypothetical protein